MKALRVAAILFGLLVVAGELIRSWGERNPAWWIDDCLVGAALIASAIVVGKATPPHRALFTGAWGFAVGVIYISFFDKVLGPILMGPGAEFSRLNAFVSISLALAIAGFAGSLMPPFNQTS